ncbi:hypothetical protein [Azospirillum thermophilum]|uniref:Uncharacterized protein n=1 Tax=Azospirillum thermophilum TaxID=2202148 RepID=A0A2S2CQI3_9PROT|nr:hypothetical protein [Azospirillum thermophilum]AWK86577.1 hypothetical protein DEW08_10285 [Azospirillum thermophilum]
MPPTPEPPNRTGRDPSATADAQRLRHRIDQGLTGDKVPATDPAAAPLGTDDEAAGTSPLIRDTGDAVPEDQRIPPGQKKGGDTLES